MNYQEQPWIRYSGALGFGWRLLYWDHHPDFHSQSLFEIAVGSRQSLIVASNPPWPSIGDLFDLWTHGELRYGYLVRHIKRHTPPHSGLKQLRHRRYLNSALTMYDALQSQSWNSNHSFSPSMQRRISIF